jgi:hypothetical protein
MLAFLFAAQLLFQASAPATKDDLGLSWTRLATQERCDLLRSLLDSAKTSPGLTGIGSTMERQMTNNSNPRDLFRRRCPGSRPRFHWRHAVVRARGLAALAAQAGDWAASAVVEAGEVLAARAASSRRDHPSVAPWAARLALAQRDRAGGTSGAGATLAALV